jgi:hypothetical protein
LPGSVAGTVVNHDNFFHVLLRALDHGGDVGNFVEGRNERAGSHAVSSSVRGDAQEHWNGLSVSCVRGRLGLEEP